MSIFDPTQPSPTQAPMPMYPYPPAPERRHRPVWTVVFVVLILAVAALVAYGLVERSNFTSMRDDRDTTARTLDTTLDTLAVTQTNLHDSKAEADDLRSQVGSLHSQLRTCAVLKQIDVLEWNALDHSTDSSLYGLQQALAEVQQVGRILDNHGYQYIDDLWADCVANDTHV